MSSYLLDTTLVSSPLVNGHGSATAEATSRSIDSKADFAALLSPHMDARAGVECDCEDHFWSLQMERNRLHGHSASVGESPH